MQQAFLRRWGGANRALVCPRGQRRTTLETEAWIAQHVLSALIATDLLEYPLKIEPSDRPPKTPEPGNQSFLPD